MSESAEKTTSEQPTVESSAPSGKGAHAKLVTTLIVVATLIGFLAIEATWINRQVFDPEEWSQTSGQLLENPAIQAALSTYMVDQIFNSVDVQSELEQVLPPDFAGLAGPATAGLRELSLKLSAKVLAAPKTQQLWQKANIDGQRLLVDVINGGGPKVNTTGGNVTLNLQPIVASASQRLGLPGNLSTKIPASVAHVTILKSNELGLAQNIAKAIQKLAKWLTVLALLLFVTAVAIAKGGRRRAILQIGIGFVAAGLLTLIASDLSGTAVVNALATTTDIRPAAEAAWTIGTSLLHEIATAVIVYGILFILAALLAGPSKAAIASRKGLAPFLKEQALAAYGLVVFILLLVIAWGPTKATQTGVGILIISALVLGGLEALRRQTAREFPDASMQDVKDFFNGLGNRATGSTGNGA